MQYDWDLNQDFGMYARWDTRYQSERNGRIEGGVEFEVKSVSNVQLGLVGDKIEVIGYVDNVFDDLTPENGVAFVDFFQNFQDTFVTYLPQGRTMGVRMSYSFQYIVVNISPHE